MRRKASAGRVWWRRILWLAAAAFAGINLLAAMHAYRFTHFTEPGPAEVFDPDMPWGDRLHIAVTGKRMPKPLNERTPADVGLVFTTHRFAAGAGVEIEAWHVAGAGPMVIVFNSYANAKSLLLAEAQAFHEMGAEVLMADLRGSGGSTGRQTTIGYHEAEDVRATVEHARAKFAPERLYLYGPSMGGAATLRAVAVHDVRVDGIIAESVFAAMTETVRERFRMLDAPTVVLPELLVFWGGALNRYWAFGHDPAAYCAATDVPVLVLGGALDDRVPLKETERLAASCRNLAGLELFPEGGHIGLLGVDRERWLGVVGEFVR